MKYAVVCLLTLFFNVSLGQRRFYIDSKPNEKYHFIVLRDPATNLCYKVSTVNLRIDFSLLRTVYFTVSLFDVNEPALLRHQILEHGAGWLIIEAVANNSDRKDEKYAHSLQRGVWQPWYAENYGSRKTLQALKSRKSETRNRKHDDLVKINCRGKHRTYAKRAKPAIIKMDLAQTRAKAENADGLTKAKFQNNIDSLRKTIKKLAEDTSLLKKQNTIVNLENKILIGQKKSDSLDRAIANKYQTLASEPSFFTRLIYGVWNFIDNLTAIRIAFLALIVTIISGLFKFYDRIKEFFRLG